MMKEKLEKLKAELGEYGYTVSASMLFFGEALTMVLDRHDKPVLEEMKRLTAEMFEQAEAALEEAEKVQEC